MSGGLALLLAAITVAAVAAAPTQHLSLAGSNWQLKNANSSIVIGSVLVPGSVRDALIKQAIIGDPLYRQNEALQHWISEDDWTFSTTFNVSSDMASHTNTDLLLDGLDTLANVWVDGQQVLAAKNFHRRHRVPLEGIGPGQHNLMIVFASPVRAVYAAAWAYPYDVPSNLSPRAYEFYNFMRKPASDFGWDWGPTITPIGIYGNVSLISYSTPWITGAHIQQLHSPSQGRITVKVEAEVVWPQPSAATRNATLVVDLPEVPGARTTARLRPRPAGVAYHTLQVQVPLQSVLLWWPRGLGPQPLYHVVTSLMPANATCDSPTNGSWPGAVAVRRVLHHPQQPCTALALRIGFRTVELVTQPLAAAWEDIHGSQGAANATDGIRQQPQGTATSRPPGSQGMVPTPTPLQLNYNSSAGPPIDWLASVQSGPAGFDYQTISNINRTRTTPHFLSRVGSQRPVTQALNASASPPQNGTEPEGESFYFRINGVPVYIRGANLIPLDVLHTRGSDPRGVVALLKQAVRANMNMIRVWGGGRYQVDELYDWCDQQGVLVWQEFMYACSPYPLIPDLLNEGVLEAQEQVRRLGYHPSIAIWGGNNEVESSFVEYPVVQDNLGLYVSDFNTWFTDKIRGVVDTLDPARPYVDTSPSNGLFSRNPYHKRWGNPQDPRYGDVHLYNYNQDCQDASLVKPAKFVSETGWQSMPSFAAIARYTTHEDWSVTAPGTQYRQRHPDGDAQLLAQLERHFRVPTALRHAIAAERLGGGAHVRRRPTHGNETNELYQTWIYLTQMQQALCITTAAARWRALSQDPNALNMGLLYWQLNDIWPGYSWSSLDYPARPGATPHWKPLHYSMARTWAPLAVLTGTTDGKAQVNVSSSWGAPLIANMTIRLVPVWVNPYTCGPAVRQQSLQLDPFATVTIFNTPIQELFSRLPGCSNTTCILTVETVYSLAPPEVARDLVVAPDSRSDGGLAAGDTRGSMVNGSMGAGGSQGMGGMEAEEVWWKAGLVGIAGATMEMAGESRNETMDDGLSTGRSGVRVTPGGQQQGGNETVWHAHTALWFAYWVDMPALPRAGTPSLSDWVVRSAQEVCFTVNSDMLLPLLVFETPFEGHFSDNMLTIDPCRPQRVCFTHDGGPDAGFSVQAMQQSLTHTSLASYME